MLGQCQTTTTHTNSWQLPQEGKATQLALNSPLGRVQQSCEPGAKKRKYSSGRAELIRPGCGELRPQTQHCMGWTSTITTRRMIYTVRALTTTRHLMVQTRIHCRNICRWMLLHKFARPMTLSMWDLQHTVCLQARLKQL